MTTKTNKLVEEGLVKELRKIRDKINLEIQDMTFEEERKFIDNLLKDSKSVRDKRLEEIEPSKL